MDSDVAVCYDVLCIKTERAADMSAALSVGIMMRKGLFLYCTNGKPEATIVAVLHTHAV